MITKVLIDRLPEDWKVRSGPTMMRQIPGEPSRGVMLTSEQIQDALVQGGLRSYEQVVEAGYTPR